MESRERTVNATQLARGARLSAMLSVSPEPDWLAAVTRDLTQLKWMVGINLVVLITIVAVLFVQ
jgi:hypothetical protein